jgi:hypothetical protein
MRGRASDFIASYGERGYYVLKAVLEASRELVGRARLGDFDFKAVRRKLEEYGLDYNPSLLLAKLEREYGLIETTYKSGAQHWWRIRDVAEIEDAIAEYEGRPSPRAYSGDPRLRLLRVQFYSLEPERLLARLEHLARSRSPASIRALREIAFRELPLLVEFLSKVEELGFEDYLEAEVALAKRILELAEQAVGIRGAGLRGARASGFEEYTLRGGVGEPV